jgi:hypothetical protein
LARACVASVLAHGEAATRDDSHSQSLSSECNQLVAHMDAFLVSSPRKLHVLNTDKW